MWQVALEMAPPRDGLVDTNSEKFTEKLSPKMIKNVEKGRWKFEVHSREFPVDVSEILIGSECGDLHLDFFTQEVDFRKNADAYLVDRVLDVIKNTSFAKNGKKFCMKTDTLMIVHI